MSKFESLSDLRMKGWNKFFHGILMFITYPIRHPFKFLLLLIVLFMIFLIYLPLNQKVAMKDMPVWYKTQFEEVWLPKLKNFNIKDLMKGSEKSDKTPKAFAKQVSVSHKKVPAKDGAENNTPKDFSTSSQKYEVWNIQKKPVQSEHDSAQKRPGGFKIAQPAKPAQIKPKSATKEAMPKLSFRKIDGLSYLDEPRLIEGAAIVYGPNELYLSGTYMYLYGIYTSEYKYDLRTAGDYLRKLVSNKGIRCYVVAETKDSIPTSICFNGNQNINQQMVDANLADDVALSEAEK